MRCSSRPSHDDNDRLLSCSTVPQTRKLGSLPTRIPRLGRWRFRATNLTNTQPRIRCRDDSWKKVRLRHDSPDVDLTLLFGPRTIANCRRRRSQEEIGFYEAGFCAYRINSIHRWTIHRTSIAGPDEIAGSRDSRPIPRRFFCWISPDSNTTSRTVPLRTLSAVSARQLPTHPVTPFLHCRTAVRTR